MDNCTRWVLSSILLCTVFITIGSSPIATTVATKLSEEVLRKQKEYAEMDIDEDLITPIQQFFQVLKMDIYLLKACIVHYENINFYLYTRDNGGFDYYKLKPETLVKSPFKGERKTVLYIHSALQEHNELYKSIKDAYFQKHDVNFIAVIWDHYSAFCEYFYTATFVVPEIGNIVVEYIKLLTDSGKAQLKDVHVIGHGLGAHIAGHAGRMLENKLGRITGLDPAKLGFEGFLHLPRLGKDANFVDVIHTNAMFFGYGIAEPIGHADFYPNGGNRQPDCPLFNCRLCNHGKSVEYFEESITSKDGFYAAKCDSWDDFENNNCDLKEEILMGEYVPEKAYGKFYLKTRSQKPYSEGRRYIEKGIHQISI